MIAVHPRNEGTENPGPHAMGQRFHWRVFSNAGLRAVETYELRG